MFKSKDEKRFEILIKISIRMLDLDSPPILL